MTTIAQFNERIAARTRQEYPTPGSSAASAGQ